MTEDPNNSNNFQELIKDLTEGSSDSPINFARKVNMKSSRHLTPRMSLGTRILGSSSESDPEAPKAQPTFNSVKLQSKPHTRYSEVKGQLYTRAQQKADLKRAINEEIKQKMEAAGESNTNPHIPRLIALKGKKKITVTTDLGTYSTLADNVVVGIHGRNRFDVVIQNTSKVYKH